MDEKSESGGRKRLPFNWIRRDLDRALAMAGLEKLEARLMVIARELCYGRAQQQGKDSDPMPFRFNIKAIARDWGAPPNNLRAARQRLIDDRLLIETPGGIIINKRYDQWQGAHALSDRQLETARAAKRHDAVQTYGEGGTPTYPLTTVKGVRPRTPEEGGEGYAHVPPGGYAHVPPNAPPLINSPVLRDLEISKTTTSRTCAGDEPKIAASDSAERKPVIELVERLNFNFGPWAIDACGVWPADWVRMVASKYLPGCKKSPMEYSKYLNSILTRWARQGHPDQTEAAPKPGPVVGDPSPRNYFPSARKKGAAG